MGDKIALGFHTCVDYELTWNGSVIEDLIRKFEIHRAEITTDLKIDSQRALLIVCLGYMEEGIGGELIPEYPEICTDFAEHFAYRITIGGTATRAAISIGKIGYECAIQMCCFNKYIRDFLPAGIHYFSSVGEDHQAVYPHVILSYQGNVRIQANDIDFITPRENRVMFSRDMDSLNMQISQEFAPMLQDTEVFLLSCFSEILDFEIMKDRMIKTRNLLRTLPGKAIVVMEDGCYIKKEHRYYAHKELREVVDVLSMNEDELQEYAGHKIDILNPDMVLEAVQDAYERTGIPVILIHSAMWALAYGKGAETMKNALEGGVAMSSARFRYGDTFGLCEYEEMKRLPDKKEGIEFCRQITEKSQVPICCIATKDLSFVENPTVVGLGDFFAGGLLPELVLEKRN